jgi:hypothetical protein
MRKILLLIFAALVVFIVSLVILYYVLDEPRPSPESATKDQADQLADRMLEAIGKSSYDSIGLIEWSFPRGHHFVWEKDIHRVTVTWAEHRVVFYPESMAGQAFVDDQAVTDEIKKAELIQEAWKLFANDSFWLVAPFKIKDPGTSRSIVQLNNEAGLLVTYNSGGVTPGDSYLWILDENYRPKAWKMWVSILPIGGIQFTWESPSNYDGVWMMPKHKGPMGINLELMIHRVE